MGKLYGPLSVSLQGEVVVYEERFSFHLYIFRVSL